MTQVTDIADSIAVRINEIGEEQQKLQCEKEALMDTLQPLRKYLTSKVINTTPTGKPKGRPAKKKEPIK